jgi:UDP-N-acetyl-D-mannosaminuronate dehydrogenase
MEIAGDIAQWHSGQTLVVEPNIHQLPAALSSHASLVNIADALAQADVLVLLVDHNEFKAVESSRITQRYIVDTKGVWR